MACSPLRRAPIAAAALSPQDSGRLAVLADHAAVSIATARASEELASLEARLEDENHDLREEVTSALGVGESVGLTKVMQQIHLVAPTDAVVLATCGERRDDVPALAEHFVRQVERAPAHSHW